MEQLTHYLEKVRPYLNSHPEPKWRFVALLVNRFPISLALNNTNKTHPLISKENPKRRLHAEINCLLKANKKFISGSSMYIFRVNSLGNLALARPCAICLRLLKKYGVETIIYSTNQIVFKREML